MIKEKIFEDLLYSIGFINNDISFDFIYGNSIYKIYTYEYHISIHKNDIVTRYRENDFIADATKYLEKEFLYILRKRKIDKLLYHDKEILKK